jgi:hypothetical protein
MSAALLQNNEKCNEPEDDRESCLHVLTWPALRFTDHTISGGGTSRFLSAFDEEYEDDEGVKGGDLQRGFLATREIPRLTTALAWTRPLESSPRHSPLVTRSLHRLGIYRPSQMRG